MFLIQDDYRVNQIDQYCDLLIVVLKMSCITSVSQFQFCEDDNCVRGPENLELSGVLVFQQRSYFIPQPLLFCGK